MNAEEQYLKLLKQLVDKSNEPHQLRGDRTGTGTYALFGAELKHDMKLGFPLLTTKRVHFKSILSELLWFMNGRTDLRTLLEQKNTIWVGDAFKKYSTVGATADQDFNKWMRTNDDGSLSLFTRDQFIEQILTNDEFSEKWGQLGPVYGKQWRQIDSSLGNIDQLSNVIEKLRTNPYDRRLIVNSWNVAELDEMILPPCHLMYQFFVEPMSRQEQKRYPGFEKKISLHWVQRSVDMFLGASFNLASYGLLLELVAKMTGYMPDKLSSTLGDTHLYSNHIEQAKIQINRQPLPLPTIMIDPSIKFDGTVNEMLASITEPEMQIQMMDYMSHSKLSAPLSN